ncbi:uncharacterized protein MYCFIDRAFT_183218 [Pseudocercospora fijiensis CIRAD86]|uniref:Uncharacterized protein n=1 Tax=Pseudocercospora fijiensis (strain CIRAD86) TaxID=383855 RepID=M3AV39_PSEFD|nr:uncharacterized protein MYCFIDRAFT_183218 [Pseudocercospora fijiensis CIRAD86]EME81028.1 hypothetical protein MYCFIDRAFT_183218 [Pseudocercospora fijiensis CIRAD86]
MLMPSCCSLHLRPHKTTIHQHHCTFGVRQISLLNHDAAAVTTAGPIFTDYFQREWYDVEHMDF